MHLPLPRNNRLLLSLALLLTLLAPQIASAQTAVEKARLERQFNSWLNGTLWQKAQDRGISRRIYVAAFKPVKLNWSLPDLQPPLDRPRPRKAPRQSEFRAPGGYFKQSHINYNVREGRKQLKKWRRTLDGIEQRYGVPREIIIAIWGKETAFGRARLPHHAVEVLATQAFMGRRKALFEAELLAALQILQQGHIPPRKMKSAWAGALGHPQFMPTAFLKYAVDFDGDGHKNIWRSVPDALASIGNFLHQNGWNDNRAWGVEVIVPTRVGCTLEGPDQHISKADWLRQGIKRADRKRFGNEDLDGLRYLLMPAGRYGPTFLVSKNFYVLKSYNESDVYALFIGHTADRMRRGGSFKRSWKRLESFSRQRVKKAQEMLERHGHDVGGADGLIGYKTRTSIGNWQQRVGLPVTCFPNRRTLASIK